jgi:phage/plasmid-associated DNA primase
MSPNEFTLLDDLYNAYRLWSSSQGVKTPMMKNHFDKSLRNSALPIHHSITGSKGFHGITVKPYAAASNVLCFPPVGNV